MKDFNKAIDIESLEDGSDVVLNGRVIFFRNNGNICFGKIQDASARVQFVLKKDANEDLFKTWHKNIKIGDIIKIQGEVWTSGTGERSVLCNKEIGLHRRSVHPFPDKHKGVLDPETRIRKRYLDVLLSPDYKRVFETRSRLVAMLRSILSNCNFVEIETPILAPIASGAQARPFVTHHNSLAVDLYLRIAPETYLKRAVAAGFDRVFEIGKNFRNEGMDPSHLQEFTAIEWYCAYWDHVDNLDFFNRDILPDLVDRAHNQKGVGEIEYQGTILNFNNIFTISFSEIFKKHTGKHWKDLPSAREVDEAFKRLVRPKLIQPVYVIDYPAFMSPLAKRANNNPDYCEQWQLVINGMELVKCYTELTDPVEQRRLLEEQAVLKNNGDEEAVQLEEDFLTALEYGIPPCSGLGLGIDRLIMLLTNQKTIRDTILFPTII